MDFLESEVDLLGAGLAAGDDLQVLCHGRTSRLTQPLGYGVTHPTMDSSSAGVNPEEVLEAKVLKSDRDA